MLAADPPLMAVGTLILGVPLIVVSLLFVLVRVVFRLIDR
jgi:hypothetical protein